LVGLLYCLGLHPTVKEIGHQVPNLHLNTWFFDDGSITGTKQDLQFVVDYLLREGPAKGIFLNKGKSLVWCGPNSPPHPDPLERGIPRSDNRGIQLLGVPVGEPSFMTSGVDIRINFIAALLKSTFPKLEDPQIQFCLLRSCLSLPKFMYVLRTYSPSIMSPNYERFDQIQKKAFENLLGAHLTPYTWKQTSLPILLGGMASC
jgi:hypothetical protein